MDCMASKISFYCETSFHDHKDLLVIIFTAEDVKNYNSCYNIINSISSVALAKRIIEIST